MTVNPTFPVSPTVKATVYPIFLVTKNLNFLVMVNPDFPRLLDSKNKGARDSQIQYAWLRSQVFVHLIQNVKSLYA